jgi:hypothetical protein
MAKMRLASSCKLLYISTVPPAASIADFSFLTYCIYLKCEFGLSIHHYPSILTLSVPADQTIDIKILQREFCNAIFFSIS